VEFLRVPIGLLSRGEHEFGNVYSVRLGHREAVILLGAEHSGFAFSQTDKLLPLKDAYPFVMRRFGPQFYFFAEDEEYLRNERSYFRGSRASS
jgi:sterol 14alpha-demethylase